MTEATQTRLFSPLQALHEVPTMAMLGAVVFALLVAPLLYPFFERFGFITAAERQRLHRRWKTWLVMAPIIVGLVMLGGAGIIALTIIASLLCYREFSRSTGLFRHSGVSLLAAIGLFVLGFTLIDHWRGLFHAASPVWATLIFAVAAIGGRASGFVQRSALGIFGFVLFGVCLGHLGMIAHSEHARGLALFLLVGAEAFVLVGFGASRVLKGELIAPEASASLTWRGALAGTAATVGTSLLVLPVAIDVTLWLAGGVGLVIAAGALVGRVVLGLMKRDMGVEVTSGAMPGHTGFMDRFDAVVLAAPGVYHLLYVADALDLDPVQRLITGGSP